MSDSKLQEIVPLLQEEGTRSRAFSQMVRLTQSRLYWHIRKMVLVHEDADDVLQPSLPGVSMWESVPPTICAA